MRSVVQLLIAAVMLVAGVVCVMLPGGCNSSTPPGPVTVRGRVTFQGQPLTGGLIVFAPDPDRGSGGRPIPGEIGPDGTFQLRHNGAEEIPPGWYRVAIAVVPDSSALSSGKLLFPLQLARPDRSGLMREVTPGKEHVFEFVVEVPTG